MKLLPGLAFIIVLAVIMTTGCTQPASQPLATVSPTPVNTPAPIGTAVPVATPDTGMLTREVWSLESIVHNGNSSGIIHGTTITAKFAKDGVLNGTAGCNNYFASYTVSGTTLSIGKTGSTLMYCGAPAGVMAQESLYLAMLQNASAFTVTEKELKIMDAGGKNQLVYVPYQPPSIEGFWKLDSIANGSTVSRTLAGTNITAVFSPGGNLTGSAGCNQYFAGYTVSGEHLNISAVGTTRMFCAEPAGVMDQESLYLGNLGNATLYKISGTQLTVLDSSGKATLFYLKG